MKNESLHDSTFLPRQQTNKQENTSLKNLEYVFSLDQYLFYGFDGFLGIRKSWFLIVQRSSRTQTYSVASNDTVSITDITWQWPDSLPLIIFYYHYWTTEEPYDTIIKVISWRVKIGIHLWYKVKTQNKYMFIIECHWVWGYHRPMYKYGKWFQTKMLRSW